MLTSAEQADRALNYLATTDLEIAEWRVAVLRTEYMVEVAEAMAFKYAEGSSVEARKQEAKTVEPVKEAKEQYWPKRKLLSNKVLAYDKPESSCSSQGQSEGQSPLSVETWESSQSRPHEAARYVAGLARAGFHQRRVADADARALGESLTGRCTFRGASPHPRRVSHALGSPVVRTLQSR